MMIVLDFLASTVGRWIAICLGASVVVASFAYSHQRKGAAKAVAKIEKATSHAANLGKSAAAKSSTDGVRGIRDPSTRND